MGKVIKYCSSTNRYKFSKPTIITDPKRISAAPCQALHKLWQGWGPILPSHY